MNPQTLAAIIVVLFFSIGLLITRRAMKAEFVPAKRPTLLQREVARDIAITLLLTGLKG